LYTGDLGDGEVAPWKIASYDVWYRDPQEVLKSQLSNPDLANEMDFAPKEVQDASTCQNNGNGNQHLDFIYLLHIRHTGTREP
jgi:Plavaka transposase